MPVTLTPYDEGETILIYNLKENWSWSEFIRVDNDVWEYFEKTDKRIDLIFDFTNSNSIPLGVGEMIKRAGKRTAPPSKGLGVVVNPPIILPIALNTLRRIFPVAASIYRIVDTLDDAIQLIETDRNR